jgi:NAD(P)-dependent dehydrogenase (short-subunit alcohol dehydrogenase family)
MANSKDVVVTGVSTGTGWGTTKVLVSKGFRVFGSVRNQADADRLQREFGNSFVPLMMDITDADADSRLGSMGECGRRTSGCIGFIPEVHACDETALHGEHVKNLAVRKDITLKALDELVHSDASPASVFLGHCKRFDMGIELTPLPSPIAADLFFSDNLAALRSLGPAHVLRHQC